MRLDRVRHVPQRSARRTDVAGRSLGAPDQAEPHAVGCQNRGDLRSELLALSLLVEHMEAPAIEHKLERAAVRQRGEDVEGLEPASHTRVQPGAGLVDRQRCHVNAEDFVAALRQPDRIGAGAAAHVERPPGGQRTRFDHLYEQRLGNARVPRSEALGVVVVPRSRHACRVSRYPMAVCRTATAPHRRPQPLRLSAFFVLRRHALPGFLAPSAARCLSVFIRTLSGSCCDQGAQEAPGCCSQPREVIDEADNEAPQENAQDEHRPVAGASVPGFVALLLVIREP